MKVEELKKFLDKAPSDAEVMVKESDMTDDIVLFYLSDTGDTDSITIIALL